LETWTHGKKLEEVNFEQLAKEGEGYMEALEERYQETRDAN